MALEVIKTLREAEQKADEILREAEANYKEIIRNGEIEANEKYSEINTQANLEIDKIINEAISEAENEAFPIKKQGEHDEEAILNLSEDKISKAVNLVIERIVNIDGDS